MKKLVLGALLAFACSANAYAEHVRFPQTGYPAFVVDTPDGWTHRDDGSGNVLLLSANHSSSFALSMVPYDGTAADLAVKALQSSGAPPAQPAGKEALAGFDGDAFDTTVTNNSGAHVNVHMIAAKPDSKHVATISCITAEDIGADDQNEAQAVLNSVDIEVAPERR